MEADDPVRAGGMCYLDDRFDDARRLWEQAFGELRAAGDHRAAGRVAAMLAEVHHGSLGNQAAAHGWLAKSRRMLELAGPCVEWGYFEIAVMGCTRLDVVELLASADRALAIATEFGDVDLEVRALADGGLALVSLGRIDEGFSRLDEALATICAGHVEDPTATGMAFCAMLSSCDRTGDVARAEEWIRLVNELVLDPMDGRLKILATHCRGALGSVLCSVGRWDDAEVELLDVIGPNGSSSEGHRVEARARLALLRLDQGRVEEADALVSPQADQAVSWLPMAEVHLRRAEPELAAAVAQRGLVALVGDVTRRAPLLVALTEARLAMGDVAGAREAAGELADIAAISSVPTHRVHAALAAGQVAFAGGDPAGAAVEFEAGLAALPSEDGRLLVGLLRLDLAGALAELGDEPAAIVEARAAMACFDRLGAAGRADEAAALLRRLGVVARSRSARSGSSAGGAAGADALTSRERDVLGLLGSGATNAEIGQQLFISAKTVEHHVGRILTKLGVRSRAEAAALDAAERLSQP